MKYPSTQKCKSLVNNSLFLNILFLFREEEGREISMCNRLPLAHPQQGPGPQPRLVP